MDKVAILAALDRMQANLDSLRALMTPPISDASSSEVFTLQTASTTAPPKKAGKKSKIQMAESLPADKLGLPPNPENPDWPEAVMPHMIVTHRGPAEKQFRALQITRLLGNFHGQVVLDVGCDEGYISREMAGTAKKVVGYDLRPAAVWPKLTNDVVSYTTHKGDVESEKYDTVLMYDVLDHLQGEEPAKFMTWLNSLLAPGGRIFVRTHPWTSKHGGHLYETGFNKAFMHLAFTADELAQIGASMPPSLRFNRPMATYEYIFREAGLKIMERKGHSEPVDQFFSGPLLDRIIKVTWKGAIDPASAIKIMANSFIDYNLTVE